MKQTDKKNKLSQSAIPLRQDTVRTPPSHPFERTSPFTRTVVFLALFDRYRRPRPARNLYGLVEGTPCGGKTRGLTYECKQNLLVAHCLSVVVVWKAVGWAVRDKNHFGVNK